MKEPRGAFVENLELRITMRRIAEFFEAMNKLNEPDRGMLFQEIAKRLSEYMPDPPISLAAPTSRPESFVDRCRELATMAPNNRIEHVLLKIAHVHEIEVAVEAERRTITSGDAA